MAIIQKVSIFAVSNLKQENMRKETVKMSLTPEEEELIKAIRNYCDSFPNGYPKLLEYVEDLFQRMIDMPKD